MDQGRFREGEVRGRGAGHRSRWQVGSDEAPARTAGRHIKENAKVPVTMRVDPDVLEAMRETGTGWQTRVNDVLRREFIRRR